MRNTPINKFDDFCISINSYPPSSKYMRQWTGSSLVQVMACRLFGTKPSPAQMLPCWQLDWKQISMKFESEFYQFNPKKYFWKWCLRNGGHFVSASTCWWLHKTRSHNLMMASSNGNIFRVTCYLCGEFTDPWWIPRTKASDEELWCFLLIYLWVNNREAGDLRRYRSHFYVTVMWYKTYTNNTTRIAYLDIYSLHFAIIWFQYKKITGRKTDWSCWHLQINFHGVRFCIWYQQSFCTHMPDW